MHTSRLMKEDLEKLGLSPKKDWWAVWPELETAYKAECDPTPRKARMRHPIGAWHENRLLSDFQITTEEFTPSEIFECTVA